MIPQHIVTINIAVEVFSSVLCFVFLICILVGGDVKKDRLKRVFLGVLLSNVAVMLSDALAFSNIGKTAPHNFVFNYIGNVCTYLFSYLLIMVFSSYIVTYLSAKSRMKRTPVYMVYGICGFAIVLTFVALFNGMYFYIDSSNIYYRNDWYWLSQMLGVFGLMINAGVIIRSRKHMSRVEAFVLSSYIVLPVIAVIIQMLVYGFVSVYIASTITIFIIYVGLQGEQARYLREKETELHTARIDIMLSQIQPHFLYNTLNTIENLCHKDGHQAAMLVGDFSSYLRENMDSLKEKNLVSFFRELEHLNIYLKIEQLRFEERLNVEHDFQVTAFSLPILSIQPLVENAVRHGITKRISGGTVTIATRKVSGGVQIIVSDDGVGFDEGEMLSAGRSHIGLSNVKARLDAQCKGTLEVKSKKGHGTTATVFIPREAAFGTPMAEGALEPDERDHC